MERKLHFRENWLICLGFWGEAELILRIWGPNTWGNTFSALRNFLSGIWGDQYIIFRDQGNTDPWDIFSRFWSFMNIGFRPKALFTGKVGAMGCDSVHYCIHRH